MIKVATWLKALRGEGKKVYKQGRQQLEYDGKFCCLGVGCDLAKIKFTRGQAYPRHRFLSNMPENLHTSEGNVLVLHGERIVSVDALNDGNDHIKPHTFKQIAAKVERTLKLYKEGKLEKYL